jgi:hypothetical protein
MYTLHNRRPSPVALHESLDAAIGSAIVHGGLESLIILVPTARRARLLKRHVLRQAFAVTGKPVAAIPVYTLEQFTTLLAERLMGSALPPVLSDGLVAAMMEQAAQNATRKRTMKFFNAAGGSSSASRSSSRSKVKSIAKSISPSVLERLTAIILGLKEDGITPANLRQDLEHHAAFVDKRLEAAAQNRVIPLSQDPVTDAARLADICALFEEYEQLLASPQAASQDASEAPLEAASGASGALYDKPALLNAVNTLLHSYAIRSMTESELYAASADQAEWTLFAPSASASAKENISENFSENFSEDDQPAVALSDRLREVFPLAKMLIADGFTEFKPPEKTLLAALYHAPFHVRIVIDYSPTNGPLFGGLDRVVEELQGKQHGKQHSASGGASLADDDPHAPRFQAFEPDAALNAQFEARREMHTPLVSYLRRWLFNTTDDISHAGFSGFVNIVGFENRADEARSIAKLVKHLVQNLVQNPAQNHSSSPPLPPLELSDIAVVMRSPELYTGLFREFFSLYDVPANITDRFPLEKSPVVTAVFAVLDMILLGFRREDVLRALQSPYLLFVHTSARTGSTRRLDGTNLFTVAERLRITGGNRFGRRGKQQWLRRLGNRVESLMRRLALLENDPHADLEDLRETAATLTETQRAFDDFQTLVALLPEPETLMRTPDFVRFVREVIVEGLMVRESIIEFHEAVVRLRPQHQSHPQTASKQASAGTFNTEKSVKENTAEENTAEENTAEETAAHSSSLGS